MPSIRTGYIPSQRESALTAEFVRKQAESDPEKIRRLESDLSAAMTEIRILRQLLGLLPA